MTLATIGIVAAAITALLVLPTTRAFAPTTAIHIASITTETSTGTITALHAISRRDVWGIAAATLLSTTTLLPSDVAWAASNPALQTLKSRHVTKGSFIPGKGIRRTHENVQPDNNSDDNNIVLLAASNPALQTFKGGKGNAAGTFYPGKGMRASHRLDDYDSILLAASNPALQTFKGGKGNAAGTFYPGKGMRAS
jgi:hypothetical protein